MTALKTIARLIVSGFFALFAAAGCITLCDSFDNVLAGIVIAPMFSLLIGGSIYKTIGGDI